MAIQLPEGLPAAAVLKDEGLEVVEHFGAERAGPRPLRIAIVNLMPTKAVTELQFARLLAATPHSVALTLLLPDSCSPKTVADSHVASFYQRWSAMKHQRFDGLIVTGAPVEKLPYEAVTYWPELTRIFDWAQQNVTHSLNICWAGQAALYHRYGVEKHTLPEKMFGLFQHGVVRAAALTRGLEGVLPVPVSRHSEVRRDEVERVPGLEILADSPLAGLCLVADPSARAAYMFNHLEYDADTLACEYRRDLTLGRPVSMPQHYFPGGDPTQEPVNRWHSHAHLFFRNWLDEIRQAAGDEAGAGTVEAAGRQAGLNWLFSLPRPALAEGESLADLLVEQIGDADRLPEILGALEQIGARPAVVRNPAPGSGDGLLLLRFAGTDSETALHIARHLARLTGILRISYSFGAREGGVLLGSAAPVAARRPARNREASVPCRPRPIQYLASGLAP